MLPISPLQPEGGVTVQFQAGAEPLLTVAANCWDPPMVTVGAAGVTVTVTAGGGGFVVATGPPPPPPQPAAAAHTKAPTNSAIFRSIFRPQKNSSANLVLPRIVAGRLSSTTTFSKSLFTEVIRGNRDWHAVRLAAQYTRRSPSG